MSEEIWKDVVGFELYYEVSNLGNIRRKSGSSHLKPKNLKKTSDKDGYHRVNLKIKQKSNCKHFHRILAIAFIENPENKEQINHINGVKYDNRLENLEWVTKSENRKHAYKTGLQNGLNRRGEKCNFVKLTKEQVLEIRGKYTKGTITMKLIASEYNVNEGCIQAIITNRTWSWLNEAT